MGRTVCTAVVALCSQTMAPTCSLVATLLIVMSAAHIQRPADVVRTILVGCSIDIADWSVAFGGGLQANTTYIGRDSVGSERVCEFSPFSERVSSALLGTNYCVRACVVLDSALSGSSSGISTGRRVCCVFVKGLSELSVRGRDWCSGKSFSDLSQ